ncbi:MAG: Acetyl-coenzyme A synthetase [Elusimicrobia bacterium]|nr:Acetyl-coenzyme A synthetase [Elusimicrobiota bacterium]
MSEITSILKEKRVFKPGAAFSQEAHIKSFRDYERLYSQAIKNPEKFWATQAKEQLHWFKPWNKVLNWKPPFAKWFIGGKINVSYNCLDRHVASWRKNKAAIIWEGEPPFAPQKTGAAAGRPHEIRTLTYNQLHIEVCKFANALKGQGVRKGDRVIIYMPMVPELAIAMLACARMGAIHSVVFGGFSAQSLVDRITDAQATFVITADGGFRRGTSVNLKDAVDEALKSCPGVKSVIVYQRTKQIIHMQTGRDHWWHDLMAQASPDCKADPLDSEHPLYILYTSGSTGKPKGIQHSTGGYLLGATYTSKIVFDLKDDDVYWCTADIGWVTGHTYVVYGPLSNGATVVMYEGAPNYPQPDRFWDIIERHKVTILYTAPTAIRAFMKWGDEWPKKHDLKSLRLLGSVGEPINPEAWMWYQKNIGGGRCPIVDTWWQTETGGILISPLPGATPTKPGSATRPLPGIVVDIVDKNGDPSKEGGFLVLRKPWPHMMRTIWGDAERFKKQYWSQVKPNKKGVSDTYFTGDGARRDKDGYYWVMGRVDDVIKVSGHRLGTAEIESALVSHPKVAEAAVVGRPDELTGEAVVSFVTLKMGNGQGQISPSDALKDELKAHVTKAIGSIARPAEIRFTDALPKTRSGKIMRRLLRDIAHGRETVGDTTTLEDFSVLAKLRAAQGEEE